MTKSRERTTLEKARLSALWVKQYTEDGMTIRQIAAGSERSYGMVHKALSDAGTEFRPRGGKVGPRNK